MTTHRRTDLIPIHAVLERGTSSSRPSDYLGYRLTADPNLRGMANVGHVIAMMRQSRHLVRPGHHVRVYLQGHAPQRWRLDRTCPGPDPVITEQRQTTPSPRTS